MARRPLAGRVPPPSDAAGPSPVEESKSAAKADPPPNVPDDIEERARFRAEAIATVAETLVARGVPKTRAAREMRAHLAKSDIHLNTTAALRAMADAERAILERVASRSREDSSAYARERILSYIRKCEGTGRYDLVARFEKLLMDVEGTRAPAEVSVTHAMRGAYAEIFATMGDDELGELAAEGIRNADAAKATLQ